MSKPDAQLALCFAHTLQPIHRAAVGEGEGAQATQLVQLRNQGGYTW